MIIEPLEGDPDDRLIHINDFSVMNIRKKLANYAKTFEIDCERLENNDRDLFRLIYEQV